LGAIDLTSSTAVISVRPVMGFKMVKGFACAKPIRAKHTLKRT